MSGHTVDVEKLGLVLDAVRNLQALSQRELARILGVSPSTLTRLNQGRMPSASALASICVWLNADLRYYVKEK